MASQVSTTVVLKAKNDTSSGLNSVKSSFNEFTQSIDSLTGGFASKLTSVLANPWTAVTAGIAGAVTITKQLYQAGVEAEKGATAMAQAWGVASEAIDDYIRDIDRQSQFSKDQIEQFALSLSGYGLEIEEAGKLMSTVSSIATVTGSSFESASSAVLSAINGQERSLNKLYPEWQKYREGADNAKEGILNLGDALHDSTVKIQSGNISNTLSNISQSWTEIQESLGTVLTLKLNSEGGPLQTIAGFLERIEKWVDQLANKETAKAQLEAYGVNRSSAMEDKSAVPNDLVWTTSFSYAPYSNTADRLTWAKSYLDNNSLTRAEKTMFNNYIYEAENGNIVTAENYWANLEPYAQKDFTFNHSRPKTSEELMNDIFDAWDSSTYKSVDWSQFTEGMLEALIYMEPDNALKQYYESKRPLVKKASDYVPSSSNSGGQAIETPQLTAWDKLGVSEGLFFNELTNEIEERESILSKITNNRFDDLTDAEWNKAINALSSISDETTRNRYTTWMADKYVSYLAYKNGSVTRDHSIVGKNFADFGMAYESYQTGSGTQGAINGYLSSFGYDVLGYHYDPNNPYIPTITRDHSTLGLAIQDMGLGYEPYGWSYNRTTPSYSEFGKNPLEYGVGNVVDFRMGVGSPYRTTGGGGVNSLEGYYLSSQGIWEHMPEDFKEFYSRWKDGSYTDEEAEKIGLTFGYNLDDLHRKEKEENDARHKTIINAINTVTQSLGSLRNVWKDGYQAGDVGTSIGSIGSMVSLFAPTIGGYIQAGGAVVGLLEDVFASDETELDESTQNEAYQMSRNVQFNGGLSLTINNTIGNLVGEDGMGQLSLIIREQIEKYAYDNR